MNPADLSTFVVLAGELAWKPCDSHITKLLQDAANRDPLWQWFRDRHLVP